MTTYYWFFSDESQETYFSDEIHAVRRKPCCLAALFGEKAFVYTAATETEPTRSMFLRGRLMEIAPDARDVLPLVVERTYPMSRPLGDHAYAYLRQENILPPNLMPDECVDILLRHAARESAAKLDGMPHPFLFDGDAGPRPPAVFAVPAHRSCPE